MGGRSQESKGGKEGGSKQVNREGKKMLRSGREVGCK